jgi:hypothetical protein
VISALEIGYVRRSELEDEDIWEIAIEMDLIGIAGIVWSTQIDVGLRSKPDKEDALDPRAVN